VGPVLCAATRRGLSKQRTASSKRSDGKNKFKQKHNKCGKIGHKEADCWDKAANRDKRPSWYKSKSEMGASVADKANSDGGSMVEYLMHGMEFPQQAKLLQDSNVWIADPGATVHSSPYTKQGMENIQKLQTTDVITMGNGKNEKAARIGNIKFTMCNKQGEMLRTGMIRDLVHLPTGYFNLFSVTKPF